MSYNRPWGVKWLRTDRITVINRKDEGGHRSPREIGRCDCAHHVILPERWSEENLPKSDSAGDAHPCTGDYLDIRRT